jgi:hypothetical protein
MRVLIQSVLIAGILAALIPPFIVFIHLYVPSVLVAIFAATAIVLAILVFILAARYIGARHVTIFALLVAICEAIMGLVLIGGPVATTTARGRFTGILLHCLLHLFLYLLELFLLEVEKHNTILITEEDIKETRHSVDLPQKRLTKTRCINSSINIEKKKNSCQQM